ncbi:hypothetical protein [Clostridium uliginosum]|uniref:Excreted virulence factor EspC, type VII ESX diderm n=1 Tax=Clostridium uliginosum TaxID=119641 RepID=A0A1I1R6Y7_9CLOT|nr:hypothetical protein [Clostridium uliginosum]SFD27938.1 hypothetical protein SAMN05421842_12920 [Clostridium uliginosum]
MADTIKVSNELKNIANIIGEAAELVSNASKMYEQDFESFIGMYLGKAENDEKILANNFIKDLNTLSYFYGQAEYYVNYCLENLSAQDKEEAESYNANMV